MTQSQNLNAEISRRLDQFKDMNWTGEVNIKIVFSSGGVRNSEIFIKESLTYESKKCKDDVK